MVPGATAGLLLILTAGRAAAGEKAAVPAQEREFTLGLVQKQQRVGMSQTEVAGALGSPNLVTRIGLGREAWIYDRFASEQ